MRAFRTTLNTVLALAAFACFALADDQMPWQPNLDTARQVAAQSNRLVLIHFWAPWCKACVQVDKEVFSKGEVAKSLEANFVFVKLNVDETPATARLYGVSSLPTDVVIAPNGRLVSQVQSPPTATQYLAQMNRAAAGYRDLTQGGNQQLAAAAPAANATANATALATDSAVTVTPAAATAPATTASAMPAAQPASQPPAQVVTPQGGDDRYADYYRQQAAATQNAAGQQPAPAVQNNAQTQAGPQQPVYVAPQTATAPQQPGQQQPTPQAGMPQQAAAPAAPAYSPPAQTAPSVAGTQPPAAAYGSANPPAADPRAAAVARPPLPQLPPGCPPVGLEGYCPVTLVEQKQWALGDKTWGVVHRGRTYLFIGPAEKDKFLANPDRYAPVLSGNDPVLALDNQIVVPGRREYGVFGADGRVYLFVDEGSLKRFDQNQKRYAAEAIQAMR